MATVTASDFLSLHKLKDALGEKFTAGIVLYDGESAASFGDRLYTVPIALVEGDLIHAYSASKIVIS